MNRLEHAAVAALPPDKHVLSAKIVPLSETRVPAPGSLRLNENASLTGPVPDGTLAAMGVACVPEYVKVVLLICPEVPPAAVKNTLPGANPLKVTSSARAMPDSEANVSNAKSELTRIRFMWIGLAFLFVDCGNNVRECAWNATERQCTGENLVV